jgi:hypothetical protein
MVVDKEWAMFEMLLLGVRKGKKLSHQCLKPSKSHVPAGE